MQTYQLDYSQTATEIIAHDHQSASKSFKNSVLCQTSLNITATDENTLDQNLENSLAINENHSNQGNSLRISQSADGEEEEVIEKSQELNQDHIFEEPAEKCQKKTVPGTCTFDSNEIIPASYTTPRKSSRHMKDSSSLSISQASAPYETLASLKESDYEEQHMHPAKGIKRKRVARKLSDIEKDNSESRNTATVSKKQKTVSGAHVPESEMQWTYSSQDAVVVAAVNERRAENQVDAGSIALPELAPKSGNDSAKGNYISPFLEDSDAVGSAKIIFVCHSNYDTKVPESIGLLDKTCNLTPTLLVTESLQETTDTLEAAEKMVCEVIYNNARKINSRCKILLTIF